MAKYSENLKDKIVHLIKNEFLSVNQICLQLGISRNTFYRWKENNANFNKALDEAQEKQNASLYQLACQSAKTKLQNYSLTETRIKYIPHKKDPDTLILKEKIVKVKEYAPDSSIIKSILEKQEQENKAQTLRIKRKAKISPLMLHLRKLNK